MVTDQNLSQTAARAGERFKRYDLVNPNNPHTPRLLPEGHRLYLDRQCAVLFQLNTEGEPVEVVCLSSIEQQATQLLLDNFPLYTPLAHLYTISSKQDLTQSRAVIDNAFAISEADSVLLPMRHLVSRARGRFTAFGISVQSVHETGYALFPRDTWRLKKPHEETTPGNADRFMTYDLLGAKEQTHLLPEAHLLHLDTEQAVLFQVDAAGEPLSLVRLKKMEMALLKIIFDTFPDYAPLPQLYAAYSGDTREDAIGVVNDAYLRGTLEKRLKPVRTLISNIRLRYLILFGLSLKSLPEMGYVLIPLRAKRGRP